MQHFFPLGGNIHRRHHNKTVKVSHCTDLNVDLLFMCMLIYSSNHLPIKQRLGCIDSDYMHTDGISKKSHIKVGFQN